MKSDILDNLSLRVQNDPELIAVILYGSYVRGEKYRDIDICLVLYPKIKVDSFEKRLEYSANLPSIFDVQVFQSLPIYIRSRIMKEGKILLNKNYDELFDLFMDTIKEYNLFLPHLNLYLEID